MLRYSLVLLVGLCAVDATRATPWADSLFEELNKDFGSTPRGHVLTHPFRLTNNTKSVVTISSVRVSCGCVSATALKTTLRPGEETAILARMDTSHFVGVRTVTIYVQFSEPQFEEVRLWVRSNSRDDVSVTPDTLAFGQVQRGTTPVAEVAVSFVGDQDSRISKVHCDSNYVQATFKETQRTLTDVRYQLTARLRPDAPVGKWYTDVWLETTNPAMPRVRVPLTVEIESALSISLTEVNLGQVKIGTEVERRIIVRGVEKFRILAIKGGNEQLEVKPSSQDSKQVHVLTVKLKGIKPEKINHVLHVVTDLKAQNEIDFCARGQVVP